MLVTLYLPINSDEAYRARMPVMKDACREACIGFTALQINSQKQQNYPPRYAIFAKGDASEKLINLALNEVSFATLFRARTTAWA